MGTTPAETFPFTSLPPEPQRQVLMHTGLLIPFRRVGCLQGLEVFDGRPLYASNNSLGGCCKCVLPEEHRFPFSINSRQCPSSSTCTCRRFPIALFATSRKLSQLAREIAFSENRILLDGRLSANITWLRSLPLDILFQIRSLDLVLNYKELRDWGALRSSKSNIHVPAEWEEFAVILDARPNLGNLSLSIDAASAHMPEDCLLLDGESYSSLPDLYKAIVKPFAARPRFRELRNFFVFWPLFQSCEAETEKAVMGMDYDSEARGKILYSNREWRLPHGREAGEFDGNADLDQNWLDNDIDCWAGFD